MPSSVWNLSPRLDALDEARDRLRLVARGREIGDELEIRHSAMVPTKRDRNSQGLSGVAGRFFLRARLEQFLPDRLDLLLERGEVRAVVDDPRRDRRRSSSEACRSIRRSASSRGMPRASRRSRRSFRGASTTITASYWRPRRDSTSSGTSWTTIPSAGAAATWRRNSSPIAGCVIASSSACVSSSRERDLGQRGPVERAVGREDLGTEPLDELRERRRARLHHLPGDQVGVDHDRAALRQHLGDGRLPRPDPAGQPHHQHGPGAYASPPISRLERAYCSATLPLQTRVLARRGHACGACVSARPTQPPDAIRRCVSGRLVRFGGLPFDHGGKACTRSTNGSSNSSVAQHGLVALDQVCGSLDAGDDPAPRARPPQARRATGVRQSVRRAELRTTSARGRPQRRHRRVRIARDRRELWELPLPGPALLEITTSDTIVGRWRPAHECTASGLIEPMTTSRKSRDRCRQRRR